MSGPTEVSIWAAELRAGTLPAVCVKSGEPADSGLKFRFSTTTRPWYNGPIAFTSGALFGGWGFDVGAKSEDAAGWLPLTPRWRKIFIAFRAAAIGFAAIGIVALVAAVSFAWPQGVALALGLLVAYFVTHTLYAGLRPKGEVHDRWLRLRDVHPNFVAAVEAWEAQAQTVGGVAPDGLSYWDGAQWVSTISADGLWKWDGRFWQPTHRPGFIG